MKFRFLNLSSLFTLASIFLSSSPANADECIADLARQDQAFCLSETTTLINYAWDLTADQFSLKGSSCTDGSGANQLVIAIDRSSAAWRTDIENQKLGSDQISIARNLIDQVSDRSDFSIALLMYSGNDECTQYTSGDISIGTEFPCLYVPYGSAGDNAHRDRLLQMLDRSEGLYSDGSSTNVSDHRIPASALKQNTLGSLGGNGLMVLLTNGVSYFSAPDDRYGFLKASSYESAANLIQAEFPVSKYQTIIGQPIMPDLLYGTTYADAMDTMCALNSGDATDCSGFVKENPRTWPVNKIDHRASLVSLVGKNSIITVNSVSALHDPVETSLGSIDASPIEAISYQLDDDEAINLTGQSSFILTSLPTGDHTLKLTLRRDTNEFSSEVRYTANRIDSDASPFTDNEMVCENGDIIAPTTADPVINLNKLQGGSASCGVVGGEKTSHLWIILMAFGPLLLVILRKFGKKSRIFFVLVLAILWSFQAQADGQGINALHYQPVNDGVSMTQKAVGPSQWDLQSGLFVDYANDVVEIGGEKNKRINSVMDDLVTAHFVGNLGLHRHVSLGLHVPFIHKSDIERDVDQDKVSGGQLGQPADMTISAKFRAYRYGTFNFAIMPVATIAQGDPNLLLGDGSPNYGAHFLFSGSQGRFMWAYSLGYLQREKPLELKDDRTETIVVRGQTISSLGGEYRINRLASVGGNLQMKFTSGQSLDFDRNSPAEWLSTLKLRPTQDLELSSGFGTGIGKGFGAPDYRVFAGIAYVPQQKVSNQPKRYTAKNRRR